MTISFPPSWLKSWKTTLVGVGAGVLGVAQGFQTADWHVLVHDHSFQTKCMIALLGFLAKDGQVTGGTSGQPSTYKALAEANQEPSKVDAPAPDLTVAVVATPIQTLSAPNTQSGSPVSTPAKE